MAHAPAGRQCGDGGPRAEGVREPVQLERDGAASAGFVPRPPRHGGSAESGAVMKIHHVVPHFAPERGGVETQVLGLARYLVGKGHEVVVHTSERTLAGDDFPADSTLDGIRIRRSGPVVQRGSYATLFRPRVEGADVVHLHGYGFIPTAGVPRKTRGSTPMVYSPPHGVAHPPPPWGARLKRGFYDPLVGRRTLRR